jgi:hypothetical protein
MRSSFLTFSLVALLAGRATAAEPGEGAAARLALVRFEFTGTVPERLRQTLTQRLLGGLTEVAFDVVGGAAVGERPFEEGRIADCRQPACYSRIASMLGVSYLVAAQVFEQNKTYEITLELMSGRSGGVVGTNRERCEICGLEETGEKVALAAATLKSRIVALAKAPARFVIRTRPTGVSGELDGKPFGRTPMDANLAAGPHSLVLRMPGYSPLERTLVATSGVDESVELDLVRLPTKFPFKTAGWTAIAAGVLLAGGGAVMLAVDGREIACTDGDRDPRGHCPRVRDTNLAGAALMGLGAISATLGGVWLYLGSPGAGPLLQNEHASLRGVSLGASGTF